MFMTLFHLILLILFFFSALGTANIADHRDWLTVVPENQSYGGNGVTKMFVFGDSYADTGNFPKGVGLPWKTPYGITFPGQPSGRFSDGRVLTDYVAEFYGLKSPLPYRLLSKNNYSFVSRFGMNFAYGGTGVFDTLYPYPNMTTQIDLFEDLLNQHSAFTKKDLQSSLFLLSGTGNDYSEHGRFTNNDEGFPSSAAITVNQIVVNMKRLHGLGARKIAVTKLPQVGCLPHYTVVYAFRKCNDSKNAIERVHNSLLYEAVAKLNDENKESLFIVLDLFPSITSGQFDDDGGSPGKSRFETPLKPCCIGIRDGYKCGSVDETGTRMYTVCENRESAFFWDDIHPTQAGWYETYNVLKSTLELFH